MLCIERSSLYKFFLTSVPMVIYTSGEDTPMLFHISPDVFVHQEIPLFLQCFLRKFRSSPIFDPDLPLRLVSGSVIWLKFEKKVIDLTKNTTSSTMPHTIYSTRGSLQNMQKITYVLGDNMSDGTKLHYKVFNNYNERTYSTDSLFSNSCIVCTLQHFNLGSSKFELTSLPQKYLFQALYEIPLNTICLGSP